MSDTKERLIKTATDLFIGKGYGAVGTAEICSKAGINKGTFYHFFPSKSDLLIAVIQVYSDGCVSSFLTVADSDISPRKKLSELFNVSAKANTEWKTQYGVSQGCLIGNMTLELSSIDEPVRKAVNAAMASWCSAIQPIVTELIDAGEIPPINPKLGAETIVALIHGALVMAKSQNDPARVTAISQAAFGALTSLEHHTTH